MNTVAAKIPWAAMSCFRFKKPKNKARFGTAAILINPPICSFFINSWMEFFTEVSVKKTTNKIPVNKVDAKPIIKPKKKEFDFKSSMY